MIKLKDILNEGPNPWIAKAKQDDLYKKYKNVNVKNLRQLPNGNFKYIGNLEIQSLHLTDLTEFWNTFHIEEVTDDFSCAYNRITSLIGCPSKVGRDFYCGYNDLTTLQYAPVKVPGNFHCTNNNLTSLQYAPKTIGGHFLHFNNKTQFTIEDVEKVSKVTGNPLSGYL